MAVVVLLGCAVPWLVHAAPLSVSDYWATIDRTQQGYLNGLWNDRDGLYEENGIAWNGLNAAMLEIAAIKARHGRLGSKEKNRARSVLSAILASNTFEERESKPSTFPDASWYRYGWHSVLNDDLSAMHQSEDGSATEALWNAWKSRTQLSLSKGQVDRIQTVLRLHAETLLANVPSDDNQAVFYWAIADLRYAFDVTHDGRFLTAWDTLTHEAVAYMGPEVYPGLTTPWLWPDYTWNYRPDYPQIHVNYFSTAYANNMYQGFVHYPALVQSGGNPFSSFELARVKAFQQHVLGGWQTNGFFNWDESHNVERQLLLPAWTTGLPALTTMVTVPALNAREDDAKFALGVFNQALLLYGSMDTWNGDPQDGAVVANFFGTHPNNTEFLAKGVNAEFAKNIAVAIDAGVFRTQQLKVDSNWRFDWDRQRLAVSTAYYSTSILPKTTATTNAPYGGFELDRLFGPNNIPLTNIAGSDSAAHGFELYNEDGSMRMTSQFSSSAQPPDAPEGTRLLSITTKDGENNDGLKAYDTKVLSRTLGNDDWISAKGSSIAQDVRLDVHHLFRNDEIFLSESYRKQDGGVMTGSVVKRVPIYNPSEVRIVVALKNGKEITVWNGQKGKEVSLKDIAWIHLRRGRYGLVIIPRRVSMTPRSLLRISDPIAAEPLSPKPSRALEMLLYDNEGFSEAHFAALYRFSDGSDQTARALFKKGRFALLTVSETSKPMIAGDFTGDGIQDTATASSNGALTINSGASGKTNETSLIMSAARLPSMAAGDINGDGIDEIIAAGITGQGAKISILSANGKIVRSWKPFNVTYSSSSSVAAGDVDGDGSDEIIVGAGPGGGPQVQIYSGEGKRLRQFFALPRNLHAGIQVLAGDVNNDGRDDIVVRGSRYLAAFNAVGKPLFFRRTSSASLTMVQR